MIGLLMLHLLLLLAWLTLNQDTSFYQALLGVIISGVIAALAGRAAGHPGYLKRLWRLICFGGYFLKILVQSNWQVAKEVMTPGFQMQPRILRYAVNGMSPSQITTLANAITLTPGTLSCDVSEDAAWLFIHCMYAEKPEDAMVGLDQLRDRMLKDIFGQEVQE